MKYPETMSVGGFWIEWESYPDKPDRTEEDMEDGLGFYGPDHLQDCWEQLAKEPWIYKIMDAMGAAKMLIVFVSIGQLPDGKDLFWAEKEILKVFRKNKIVLTVDLVKQ